MPAEDREIFDFRKRLLEDVRDRAAGGTSIFADFAENAFTDVVAEWLSEIGMTESPEVCFCEGRDGRTAYKVNGYAVSDDEDTLDLFTVCYFNSEDQTSVQPDVVRSAAQRALRFFDAAKADLAKNLEVSTDSYSMASRICETVSRLNRVRIFVLTDGRCSLKSLDREERDDIAIHYEILDAERLYRLMQAGLPREEIEVDFTNYGGRGLSCVQAAGVSEDYDAYLALIPGEVLYNLYDEYGSRLLELNVRSFLQARGKVNRGIRDTLRNEPDRFLAFNNGIVATVDEIRFIPSSDGSAGTITYVRGLQIVNGGQTTASIHKARRDDRVDLSKVFVPAKISVISSNKIEEMVPRISQYANTQNAVQMADFSANDPFHIEIERLSESVWCPGEQGRWFYERARGQYEVAKSRAGSTPAQRRRFKEQTPASRKLNKVDLAKFVAAWAQRPDKVSLGGQKCFSWFMQDLHERQSRSWVPDELYFREIIAKGILFKEVTRIVRVEGFPAYRANIVAYLVSYLSYKTGRQLDLELIWKNQKLSDALKDLIQSWSYKIRDQIVETSAGRNVTEWCKKEDCWSSIRRLAIDFSAVLPEEISGVQDKLKPGQATHQSDDELSHEDLENIYKCQQLSAFVWIRISEWGQRSGRLKAWEGGIAHTLSGYAAGNWSKQPSVKQARHGVRIIKQAVDEGVMLEEDAAAV